MKQPLLAVGHDVVHLHDLGLRGAPDPAVVEAAVGAGRVLVTLDTDFGELVARRVRICRASSCSAAPSPDVPTGRPRSCRRTSISSRRTSTQAPFVVIGDDRVRVRRLPIE